MTTDGTAAAADVVVVAGGGVVVTVTVDGAGTVGLDARILDGGATTGLGGGTDSWGGGRVTAFATTTGGFGASA